MSTYSPRLHGHIHFANVLATSDSFACSYGALIEILAKLKRAQKSRDTLPLRISLYSLVDENQKSELIMSKQIP